MRTVFRFSKYGAVRYISHLDLMRAMSRAVRRAGLPVKYTQGFHPHVEMAFAQALGVGYASRSEYMEIGLNDTIAPESAAEAMNSALPEGFVITGAWRLADGFPSLMASVSAARWLVEFDIPSDEALVHKFDSLIGQKTVEVVKEGRNGPSNLDIRPGIYSVESAYGGVELMLAAGSRLNIRPELAVQAALGNTGEARAITRLELYTLVNGRQTPLHEICVNGESDKHGEDHTG